MLSQCFILSEKGCSCRVCEFITGNPRKGETIDKKLIIGCHRVETRQGQFCLQKQQEKILG